MRLPLFGVLACGLIVQTGCGSFGQSLPTWQSTFAATTGTAVAAKDPLAVDIPIAKPTDSHPVTVAAAVSRARVAPGEQIVLVVRCQTAKPWYIYAVDGSAEAGVPTRLNLRLPPQVSQSSPWQLPTPAIKASPLGEISSYAGDFRFMIPLEIAAGSAPRELEIECEISYQACSDATCLAPDSQRLVIPLTVHARSTIDSAKR